MFFLRSRYAINTSVVQVVSSCLRLIISRSLRYFFLHPCRNLASSTVVQDSCLSIKYDRALWLLVRHLYGGQLPIDSLAPLDKTDIG